MLTAAATDHENFHRADGALALNQTQVFVGVEQAFASILCLGSEDATMLVRLLVT